jgi:pentatricopeptide repeat-containing protein PET309
VRPLCATTPQESADPDKAWEAFLAMVKGKDVVIPRRLRPPLYVFATRLADGVFTMACESSSTPAEAMSSRAAKIRRVLQVITDSSYPPRQELDILEARCMALEGRLEEVEAILNDYSQGDLTSEDALNATPIVQITQTMVRVINALHGPEAAYDWIVSRWKVIEQYISAKSLVVYSRASRTSITLLRNTLMRTVKRIDNPGDFLTERIRARPDGPWEGVGEHLIDALCSLQLFEEALDVMRRMEKLSISSSVNTKTSLVRVLVSEKRFKTAHQLYTQVREGLEGLREKELREVLSTGVYLHAMEGNVGRAKLDFMRLEQRGWVNFDTITSLLHATALRGLAKETIETFERFFPRGTQPSQYKYGKPDRTHYTEVLLAHAQTGTMDRVHIWLKRMMEDKISPDAYTYAILLKGFAFSNDVSSLLKLLRRMKTSGVKPNLYGYTIVISFLARAGDSVGAERTYKQALKDGVKPDIRMLNALMYAHVQSRYWQGVIDTFNYIKSIPDKRYRPTTATYNTLLKAYILIGTPFSTISDLVAEQEAIGTRPDAHTFALLVQSACDHREFDLALGLLDHMDRLAGKIDSEVEVTVYVLAILMGTFLKNGDKVRAREMFVQMKTRKIVPTAITYSKIIHAYAQEGTAETLALAEEFLRKLISEGLEDDGVRAGWISNSGGRSLALETLYQPLMYIYARLQRVEDVQRLQQELLDHGGRPSLGGLTALLAAYRNNVDVESGKQTWSLLFEMACQHSTLGDTMSSDETKPDERQEPISRSNILCVPLSIYVDLLSSTGNHTEIAKVWDELRTHGFTFDSHNWNHLIIALVRAGEPERAFAILERVILPNATPPIAAREAEDADRPDSPLSIVGGSNEASLPVRDGSVAVPPAWTETNVHKRSRRMEVIRRTSEQLDSHLISSVGPRGNFTHRLESLQLIPFDWNSWQPHSVTLSVLSQTLARLASGRLLHPIRGDSGTPDSSIDESTPSRDSAKDVLNRIYANYDGAVRAVKEFDRRRRDELAESLENGQLIRWT